MKDTLSAAEASESWSKVRDPFSASAGKKKVGLKIAAA
jgi:hypothetical protein